MLVEEERNSMEGAGVRVYVLAARSFRAKGGLIRAS